jgi:hypothetical protein
MGTKEKYIIFSTNSAQKIKGRGKGKKNGT